MAQHHADKHGFKSRVILGEYRTPRMVAWLMKQFPGVIKTERRGGYLLFVLIAAVLLSSVCVFASVLGWRGISPYRSYAPLRNASYQFSR